MRMGELKHLCCYLHQQNPVMIANSKDNLLYETSFFLNETFKRDGDEMIFYLIIIGFRRFNI